MKARKRGSPALRRYHAAIRAIRRETGRSYAKSRKLYRPALARLAATTAPGQRSPRLVGQAASRIHSERKERGQIASGKRVPKSATKGVFWVADDPGNPGTWASAFEFLDWDMHEDRRAKATSILANATRYKRLAGWRAHVGLFGVASQGGAGEATHTGTLGFDDNGDGIDALRANYLQALRELIEGWEGPDAPPGRYGTLLLLEEMDWDTVEE